MKLTVFGLSLSSSWGNGHATTYRALLRAFAARGHQVAFYEWDAPWYGGSHRDLPEPRFCRLVLYGSWDAAAPKAIREAAASDAVLVGSYVREGPRIVDALAGAGVRRLCFYDIDTPVTVAQLRRGDATSLRPDQVSLFELYLSFTGGPFLERVVERELGARRAEALYCAVDPSRHAPVPPDLELAADLAYMGTYAADRQRALARLLGEPARRLPRCRFLIAGPKYPDALRWPPNVRRLPHVAPRRHAAFYSSSDWQLNLTREEMVAAGWSPSVRLFEAAGCGAAILSDRWPGLDRFFRAGREILLPGSAEEVVDILRGTHPDDRRQIGDAARRRILAEHTAARRAEQLERLLRSVARREDVGAAREPEGLEVGVGASAGRANRADPPDASVAGGDPRGERRPRHLVLGGGWGRPPPGAGGGGRT